MKNPARQSKATKWVISPWWNNGDRAEIGENAPLVLPGRSPIRYKEFKAIWDREREEFRYNPRFLPNTVTFDRGNRPVMRVGVHDILGQHATVYYADRWVEEVYIQTLNDDGKWMALPLHDIVREVITDGTDDLIFSGTFQPEEQVVFDASGDAYTIVRTSAHGDHLLHSRDGMENWAAYLLPGRQEFDRTAYRIERTAKPRPPVIFALHYSYLKDEYGDKYDSTLSIIAPQKKSDGTLKNLKLRTIDEITPSDGPSHSGVSDQTVTLGNKTHVVYIGTDPLKDQEQKEIRGTPQYIVSYNHNNLTTIKPKYLGSTDSVSTDGFEDLELGEGDCPKMPKPTGGPKEEEFTDHHNGPAIAADSQGYLHVVMGAHQYPFKYRRSTRPNDSTAWEDMEIVSNCGGMETYVSLVIDQADTLHLVSRMVDTEGYSLHYMRKRRDEAWHDLGKLIVPKHKIHGLWYQKLTIDRCGRLFLAYFYLADKLSPEELEAYRCKWPNEEVTNAKTNAHDPVILISSDSGYSWKIATTQDFFTAWDWVSINSPAWSDAKDWHKASYYSTIQTAVVKNTLYLLGRGEAGMHIWEFAPETNTWSKIATNIDLSDAAGWDDVSNYSTIQTAVVNHVLYLIARGNKGMLTWELQDNHWSLLEEAKNDPPLSDDQGWKDVANYSTIQTAVVRGELYLLARGGKGLWTWKLDLDAKHWVKLAENDPELADSNGWNDPANYSTIQTAVVRGKLYLLARGGKGMQTWRFDPKSRSWIRLIKDSPKLADTNGWDDVANYSTIQTAFLNHKLYLLARGDKGMQTWVFDPDVSPPRWTRLVKDSPDLSDAEGWDDVTNYTTIQAVVRKGELYLLARANAGIYTWKFIPENNTWSRLARDNPGWSDASGWDDATNYTTIQAAATNNELYLLARANDGVHTWKFNRAP